MLSISSLKEQLSGKIQVHQVDERNKPPLSPPTVATSTNPGQISSPSATSPLPSVSSLKQQLFSKINDSRPETTITPLPVATSALLDIAIASMEASVNSSKAFHLPPTSANYGGNNPRFENDFLKSNLSGNSPSNVPDLQLEIVDKASTILTLQSCATTSVDKSEDILFSGLDIIFESLDTKPDGTEDAQLIVPFESDEIVLDNSPPTSLAESIPASPKDNSTAVTCAGIPLANVVDAPEDPATISNNLMKNSPHEKSSSSATSPQMASAVPVLALPKSPVNPSPIVEPPPTCPMSSIKPSPVEVVENIKQESPVEIVELQAVPVTPPFENSIKPRPVQNFTLQEVDSSNPKELSPSSRACLSSPTQSCNVNAKTTPKRVRSPRKRPSGPLKTYPIRSSPKKLNLSIDAIPEVKQVTKLPPLECSSSVKPNLASCNPKLNPLILLCKEQLNEKLSHNTANVSPAKVSSQNTDSVPDTSDCTFSSTNKHVHANNAENNCSLVNTPSLVDNVYIKTEVVDTCAENVSNNDSATLSSPTGENQSADDAALADAIRLLANWSSTPQLEHPERTKDVGSESQKMNWSCSACGRAFVKLSYLKQHMRDHHDSTVGKPHTCIRCRKSFKHSVALKRHKCSASNTRKTNHATDNDALSDKAAKWPYFCCSCDLGFLKKLEFEQHYVSHASNVNKDLVCIDLRTPNNEENEGASTGGNARKGPHFCKICSMGFIKKSDFTKHQLLHPADANPEGKSFTCTICDKHFTNSEALHGHMNLHTGQDCYMCRYCSRMFARKGIWQEHERHHSGEMPLTCQFCGKHFKQKSSLHYHELHHMGVIRHACPYCHKAFVEARSLRTHVQTHIGFKLYKCHICQKGFSQKSSLKYHYMQHTFYNRCHCRKCDIVFPTPEGLDLHLSADHTSDEEDIDIDEVDSDFGDELEASVNINLGITISDLKQKVRTLMSANENEEPPDLHSPNIPKRAAEQMISKLRQKVKGIMSEEVVPLKKIKK